MGEYLQETLQLAERYGISAEDIGVYLAHAGDRPKLEAACAARARGLTHAAVRQALIDGATAEQLNALRALNEGG